MSGEVQPLQPVRGRTWLCSGANVSLGSDATPEIGAGVFIEMGLLGSRLNLRRHVTPEAVGNGAAERTLTDNLKSACEADGKTLSGMPSGVQRYLCPSDKASQCRSAPGPVAIILGPPDCPSGGSITVFMQTSQNWKISMAAPKITSADHSARAPSPRERLTKSRVDRGDASHVNETGNGIEQDPYDPEFEAQMAVAEDIMRENRDLLRKLAK